MRKDLQPTADGFATESLCCEFTHAVMRRDCDQLASRVGDARGAPVRA